MKRMKHVICFCIVIIMVVNICSCTPVNANKKADRNTCKEVANYIKKNTKKFAKAYNKTETRESDKFYATSVEKQVRVKILDNNTTGIYLDFNKDNGYMLIDANGEIIEFEVSGELSYLKKKKKTYYCCTEGFMYYDSKGKLASYKRGKKNKNISLSKKSYKGTDDMGVITNVDRYVKDRYGKNCKLKEKKSLKKYVYSKQWDTTVYYTIKNGLQKSESNCTLNSIYSALGYLQAANTKFLNLPISSLQSQFDATKDSFYSKYSKNKNYYIETPKPLPVLYQDVRQYAVDKGYYNISGGLFKFEGTNPFNIKKIIKEVCKKYNITAKASHVVVFTFKDQVQKEIDAGYPTIFNMTKHSTYGGHSVVATGYRVYQKTKKVFGIKITKKVQIMEIADNWTDKKGYLDYDAYNCFGSFVKIR